MSTPFGICRRIAALLAPWLAVFVLFGSMATALHHHADGSSHDQCAVCCHGPTPAVAATCATLVTTPAVRSERSTLPAAPAPRSHSRSTSLSRAPPLA